MSTIKFFPLCKLQIGTKYRAMFRDFHSKLHAACKFTHVPDHGRLVPRLGADDELALELVLVVEVVPRPQVGVLGSFSEVT